MKRILLPILALLLSATTINAQTTTLGENQEYLVLDGSTTMTGEDEGNAFYVTYFGDAWKIEATYAKFSKELLKDYAGYKIVGVSIAGAFATTDVPCFIKSAADSSTPATTLAETTVKNAVPSVLPLKTFNWNDAFFEEAYTIPTSEDDMVDIYAGYSLLDADGNMKTKQILVGEAVEGVGVYLQQNEKISDLGQNVLPVKLIIEKPATSGGDSEADKEYLAAHGVMTDTTGDATKITGYDENYDFYHGLLSMDMDAVFARFTTEDLEPYIGYKVVGLSVAGEFASQTTDFLLNIECNQTFGEEVKLSSKNVAIAKDAQVTPSVQSMGIYTWNDVMFDTPYTIPSKKENAETGDPEDFQDLYAGYWIKNSEGEVNMDRLLVGQLYDNTGDNPGWYVQQTGSSTKVPRLSGLGLNLLPVKLILEKTTTDGIENAETATDANATEVARYSLDGKRIYVPARGINIVKMSDGTTRKVMIRK